MFQKVMAPPPGSALRKALLDSLRRRVEKALKPPVVFVVQTLRVLDDWAYIGGEVQRPGGKPVDFKKIPEYRQFIADGVFDGPTLFALLKREKGTWTVKAYVIGPTDVAWSDWPHSLGVPKAVLPFPDSPKAR